MKTRMAQKAAYIGIGLGLTVFTIYGLMPGAFLGGVMGLHMANMVTGAAGASVLARMLVAGGMVMGVCTAALIVTVTTGTLGWALGSLMDMLSSHRRHAAVPVRH